MLLAASALVVLASLAAFEAAARLRPVTAERVEAADLARARRHAARRPHMG